MFLKITVIKPFLWIAGEGEFIDLEKTFKKQFESLDDKALEVILISIRSPSELF